MRSVIGEVIDGYAKAGGQEGSVFYVAFIMSFYALESK